MTIQANFCKRAEDIRRVWWCPTGPLAFLPIHAAGIYPDGPKLSEHVISSYTPTLSALLSPQSTNPTAMYQLLTVALPNEARLPGTGKELDCVAKWADGFSLLRLLESEATQARVSEAMKNSSWVHFACHGSQNGSNPTDSCLSLSGGSKLSLSEIIKMRLQNPELAFMSACETATGDATLEDEAVHLAAGMLMAGYKGVIATMWTIPDDFAVEVADETYRLLFREYNADSTQAAEALQFAVQKLVADRKASGKTLPLFSWLPFIHLGI